MTIYLDISAAVHRRAGLGRYAESLARELLPLLGDRMAFFYNRERGIEPLAGLENVPARTVSLGYKPWRMLVWGGQMAHVGFNRLAPGIELFHATEHLLMPLRGIPTVLTVHDLIFRRYPQHHKPLNRWYLNATLPLFCRRADAHHRCLGAEQARRDRRLRHPAGEDHGDLRGGRCALSAHSHPKRWSRCAAAIICPNATYCSSAPSSRAKTWGASCRPSSACAPKS